MRKSATTTSKGSATNTSQRPLWRRRGARLLAALVILTQTTLVLNGYRDPHNYFAFQPFNESSTYAVDLERVLYDGRRIPIKNGRWEGYDWDELIGWRALRSPWSQRHAFSGIDAVMDFLDNALNWIANNTPNDTSTRYLEAQVTYYRNARGPYVQILRSHDRALTPANVK